MTANSKASVDAAQGAGATSAAQQLDYGTNRTQDVDKDVGADERYEAMSADAADAWRVNGKRTYDLHQTLDTDKILQAGKQTAKLDSMELAEREQRMRHTEAEFNQRMRHADTSNTVVAAILGDMAEKLEYITEKVKG